jgi:hypothetical protein
MAHQVPDGLVGGCREAEITALVMVNKSVRISCAKSATLAFPPRPKTSTGRSPLFAAKVATRSFARRLRDDGRTAAKARGAKFGRKPKLDAHQQREARTRLGAGESSRAIARTYRVHHATIARLI